MSYASSVQLKFLYSFLQLPKHHYSWVPCDHAMARPQVADVEDSLKLWRVAATRGGHLDWPLAVRLKEIPHIKKYFFRKSGTRPQTWTDSSMRPAQFEPYWRACVNPLMNILFRCSVYKFFPSRGTGVFTRWTQIRGVNIFISWNDSAVLRVINSSVA
jgi:hypothetical protein